MKKEIEEGTQGSADMKYCGCSENDGIVDRKLGPLLSEEVGSGGGGTVE